MGVPGARAERALEQNPAHHSRHREDAALSLFLLHGLTARSRAPAWRDAFCNTSLCFVPVFSLCFKELTEPSASFRYREVCVPVYGRQRGILALVFLVVSLGNRVFLGARRPNL